MITNISYKDKSPMSFGRMPKPNSKYYIPNGLWQKLLGDIEVLPQQDAQLGSLIRKDELFQKTLGKRGVKVQPENVREFFQYLTSTLRTKNPALDKRPIPQRLSDLTLFVRKVLCTIHKRKKMSEGLPTIIANHWNVECPLYFD